MIFNTDIKVWIHNKYQNNIIPRIPELITTYLLENKDKLNLYFNKNITINELLNYISKEFKNNPNAKLIDLITSYVEKNNESRI